MKIILIISLLYVSIASTIFGKKASEQFLPKIMKWLKDQDIQVDQSQAFLALAQIIKSFDEELNYDGVNQEGIAAIEKKLLEVCLQSSNYEQQLEEQVEKYISDELQHSSSYFKNMIKDKEKMIEQDNREIDKLKRQSKDNSLINEKLKDITELLNEIDSGLENETSDRLYKILEIIESKMVVGWFSYQQQYEEIAQFLQDVDRLFKTRNNFSQDRMEIISQISIVKNVLLDMKLNILVKVQENNIDQFERLTFFENSKVTHTKAKDYFINEYQSFLGQLLHQWKQFLSIQYEVGKDRKEFQSLCEQFSKQSEIYQKKNGFSLQNTKLSLKHIESDFVNHQI